MKNDYRLIHVISIIGILLIAVMPAHAMRKNRLIKKVNVSTQSIDVSSGDTSGISFNVKEAGKLDLFICDLDGNLVRTLMDKSGVTPGGVQASWDGKDDDGNICSEGIYIPIIKLHSIRKGDEIYNPSVSKWGKEVSARNLVFDAASKTVSYSLDTPVFCRLLAGEKDGGPVYKTIFNWEYRSAGNHQETWDGMDADGIIEVNKRPKFHIWLEAFNVPENGIVLAGSDKTLQKAVRTKKRVSLHPSHGRHKYKYVRKTRFSDKGDRIKLKLLGRKRIKKGLPVLKNTARFKVAFRKKAKHDLGDSSEVCMFMDGTYFVEIYDDTIPLTVNIDTTKYSNGEHFITANFRVNEKYVDTCSLKFWIEN